MIYLRLQNLQPLCISGQQAQGAIRNTLDYIPGSTLRGAIASQLQHHNQTRINQLILDPNLRYRNLHPLPTGTDLAHPLPRTARSCKLNRGFHPLAPKPGSPPHGVQDILIPLLRYILDKQTFPPQQCQQCDLPLTPFDGYYNGTGDSGYQKATIAQRHITQTAIDPNRETAQSANLFTTNALDEQTYFAGYLTLGSDEDETEFINTICPTGQTLRLGYGRTRGMGLITVDSCESETANPWKQSLTERIVAFNELAKGMNCPVPAGQTLFTLTLQSHTLLLDPYLRPQTNLDTPTLAREIHPQLANSEHLATFAATHPIHGWSSPHGLPLTPTTAIATSSVFVFQTPLSPNQLADIFNQTQLEQQGIGERRNEGFGQLTVCHPFHQQVNPL